MRRRNYFAWGAGILVAAAVASLIAALPARDAFCTLCGARETTRGYTLRFTRATLFERRSVCATAFSSLLTEKHLVAPHAHVWQEPRLVPDPMDELGPPVLESLGFLSAPRIVHFTKDVAEYADPVSAAQWRDLVLQPRYSYVADSALRFLRVPAEGFANRTDFLQWWGEHAFAVYNRLREVTEPD